MANIGLPEQRRTTSSSPKSSSSERQSSPAALTATGIAATAATLGSVAWYYYAFGNELHAMTPAEEGSVPLSPVRRLRASRRLDRYTSEPVDG